MGYSCGEVGKAGYNCEEAKWAGYSYEEAKEAGCWGKGWVQKYWNSL